MQRSVAEGLPYSRLLDYCAVSYIVSEADARANMRGVLRRLSMVPEEKARQKLDALRRIRDAFVFRANRAAGAPPDAADYILSEACHAAKAWRQGNPQSPAFPTAGGSHSRLRCQLK